MAFTPDEICRLKIFHPHAFKKLSDATSNGTRLVHYTRADAAMNILKTKKVWMRKTSCMNDFMEVRYGHECLSSAYENKVGKRFKSVLNDIFPKFSDEIDAIIGGVLPNFLFNSYLVCLSEHLARIIHKAVFLGWRAWTKLLRYRMILVSKQDHPCPAGNPARHDRK